MGRNLKRRDGPRPNGNFGNADVSTTRKRKWGQCDALPLWEEGKERRTAPTCPHYCTALSNNAMTALHSSRQALSSLLPCQPRCTVRGLSSHITSLRPMSPSPCVSPRLLLPIRAQPPRLSTAFHFSTSRSASATPPLYNSSSSTAQAHYEKKQREAYKRRNQSLAMYTLAVVIFGVGFTYASVPLYRAFCSATGFGGTPMVGQGRFEPSRLVPFDTNAKKIRVTFNADCSDELPWSFQRSQDEIYVIPGETSLAFFTAKNRSKKDIIGIATYNVAPDRVSFRWVIDKIEDNLTLHTHDADRTLLFKGRMLLFRTTETSRWRRSRLARFLLYR